MVERLNTTLQENLITILAYDEQYGRVVANIIDTNLMEGEYRTIAERCIDYWADYKKAPGDHTADLMSDIIDDKHNRRAATVKRILSAMVQLSETVNTDYVMTSLRTFQRMQRIKGAIIQSAELINNNAQMSIPEIEEIWNGILRTQEVDFDPGIKLTDVGRIIERLESLQSEFVMGIEQLDQRNIGPARGQLMIVLAAAGRGKTWALVHIGAEALAQRKKVLHLSLEIDAEYIAQRYFQRMFSITKRDDKFDVTHFNMDMDRLEGFDRQPADVAFSWDSSVLRSELLTHMDHIGPRRFDNLIIKRFAPQQLTTSGLNAFLDTLETTEKFIPDMIIVDYAALMKLDERSLRQSLGRTMVGLRGIAVERNAAMVTAHQSSKAGEEAPMITATHVAEDWSIVGTADTLLTYSCTPKEFAFGLGRLFVAKARSEEDRFALMITQSYKMGQFCMESMYMDSGYFDELNAMAETDDTEGSDDDDD